MSDTSRKEAIENLETLKAFLDINGVFTISDAMKKSIDFAIASLKTDEAYDLEYEQPEFCKDCISREAVYYYISSHIHEIITESGTDKNAHTNAILRSLANGVKTMPSVLPKVTKNDLGVDAVSRQAVLDLINADWKYEGLEIEINSLPSVTPIRSKGH